METVILKNGSEEAEPLVTVLMGLQLPSLIKENPIAFYELVDVCRNPEHKFFGDTQKQLRDLNLLEADGQPHSSVRNIVLCATEGEGMKLKLVNPLKELKPWGLESKRSQT